MALENDWGTPPIHGELEKLGFTVSEATVSRYMPWRPAKTDVLQRWLAFLRNHKEGIAAMDFFTVPTASLRILYCWFVIHHERRRILHFNATFNPNSAWVNQQLREAFPVDTAARHLIFDRDSIFSREPWSGLSSRWARNRAAPPIAVPGRILSPNGGSAAAAANSSITWSYSASATLFGSLGSTSPVFTRTARISASARKLHLVGP
jgi:hypothetical protein